MMKIFDIFTRKTVKVLLLPILALCLSAVAFSFSQAQELPSLEDFRNSEAYKKAKETLNYQSNNTRPAEMDATYETLQVDHPNYANIQKLKTEKDAAIYDDPTNKDSISQAYDEAIAKEEYLFMKSFENNYCADSCSPKCYYSEIQDCTFCDLFRVAFNACSKIANHAIETFSGPLFQLVIVGFALWLAVLTLNFVSSIETRDFKDFASSVITQGFYVLIALILLKTGAMSFFNLALEPVFNTGQNIAQATISPESVATSATDEDAKVFCPASGSYGIIDSEEGGALPASMGENIICTMTLIQARAAKVSALGSATICYSWEKRLTRSCKWPLPPVCCLLPLRPTLSGLPENTRLRFGKRF